MRPHTAFLALRAKRSDLLTQSEVEGIVVDTSSLSAHLAGLAGPDVDAVDQALADTRLLLPPVVATETSATTSRQACGSPERW